MQKEYSAKNHAGQSGHFAEKGIKTVQQTIWRLNERSEQNLKFQWYSKILFTKFTVEVSQMSDISKPPSEKKIFILILSHAMTGRIKQWLKATRKIKR